MGGVWDFITRGIGDESRLIYPTEMALALSVFQRTLPPPGRILISDDLIDGDALTEEIMGNFYTLYIGPKGYENARSLQPMWNGTDRVVDVFIHEMTHVWQFHHGIWVWYEGAKVHIFSDNAYSYSVGKDWDDYDVEQQAQIVQDWFAAGMKDTHENYPYIRDCIRQGKTEGKYNK